MTHNDSPAIPRFEFSGVSKRAPSKFRLIRSTWVSPVSKFRPLPWFFGTFWLWFFPGAVIVIFFLSFFALFFLSALTFMIVVTPAAATVGSGQGATRIRRAPTAPYSTTGWASEGVQLKCKILISWLSVLSTINEIKKRHRKFFVN